MPDSRSTFAEIEIELIPFHATNCSLFLKCLILVFVETLSILLQARRATNAR